MNGKRSFLLKRRLTKKGRWFVGLTILTVFAISLYILFKGIILEQFFNNPILFEYDLKKNVDYRVHLFQNSLYDETVISSNSSYVGNLTDDINIDFDFKYRSNKNAVLSYKYYIESIIYADATSSNDSSNVWKRKEILLPVNSGQLIADNKFGISEHLVYDYSLNNDIAKDYKKQMAFSMNTYSIIKFVINIHGNIDGNLVDENETMSLKVPLNESVFKIEKQLGDNKKVVKRKYENPKIIIRLPFLLIGSIGILLAIALFIILFRKIFNIKRKNEYNRVLGKILKEYGDVIVEVRSVKKIPTNRTIIVKDFNEMIDLEEETRIPINFMELEADIEGVFWIVHNESFYTYILKQEELVLNNKNF